MSSSDSVLVPREPTKVRSSSDEQLIDQARVLFEKFRNVSSLGVDEAWVIRQGGSDWSVIATRQTTHPDATPYEVVKATTRDPYVAAMLTFMSTGLPRLCDLADQALAASPQQSPISGGGAELAGWQRRMRNIMAAPNHPWFQWSSWKDCDERQRDECLSSGGLIEGFPELRTEVRPVFAAPPVPSVSGPEDQGSSLRDTRPAPSFQSRVLPWLMECFGAEIAADRVERCDRFIEEALELAQSLDWAQERAHALVEYVYGRPVGEPYQEVGGVMVTLAALCEAAGLDMQAGDALERLSGLLGQIAPLVAEGIKTAGRRLEPRPAVGGLPHD